MNTTKELIKYHIRSYLKSNKGVMPLATLIIFLFFAYSNKPVNVVGSFTLSMVCVFYIMIWIGLTYNDIENPISEQLMVLKVHSEKKYYISKALMLVVIGIIISIITVFFPVVQNALNHFNLYARPINIMDVLIALILHCFVAFTASMTGSILHPRIMEDRKMAVVLTFLIALMGIVKVSINDKAPVTRLITWIFPPIANVMKMFSGEGFYDTAGVGHALLLFGVYGIVLMVLQIHFLIKNKF